MKPSEVHLVVHTGDTKRGRTLGVAHYAANMIVALAARPDVRLTILGDRDVTSDYADERVDVVALDELAETATKERLTAWSDALVQIHHFLPRKLEVPTITIVHDLHLFDVAWKYGGSTDRLESLLLQNLTHSSFVVSQFPRTISELTSRDPTLTTKAKLIGSPTLIDDFECTNEARVWARSTFGLDASFPTLLYPSQLQAHKNHWNLIAALDVLSSRNRPARMIFTGSSFHEHLMTSIIRRVSELGISEMVSFAGHVSGEELRGLYAEVDAVISPSLAEGGAYIAQEAIVHDKPVACSELPSVRAHLARLEVEVPLFDPFDVVEIARSIEILLDEGDSIVSGYGRAREIINSMTWDSVAQDIVRLAQVSVDPNGEPEPFGVLAGSEN